MSPFVLPEWSGYLRFRDEIGAMLDSRMHTLDWLDGQVLTGRARVWLASDAIMLTELRHYPTGACDIHGLVAAGNLATIVDLLIPQAEEYAGRIGCLGAVIESRNGWARVMKRYGYDLYQTTVRKDF